MTKEEAIALGSVNLRTLLGDDTGEDADLVVRQGGDMFETRSKVVGVISPRRALVHMW
jgi:hypothetical protein